MSFRLRLLLGVLAAAILPLAGLGIVVRREMIARLETADHRRVAELLTVIRHDVASRIASTRDRLEGLALDLDAGNQLRLALRGAGQVDWLRDWAASAARQSGLPFLSLHDGEGRILSSGHFRNDYGRPEPALLGLLATPDSAALAVVATADGPRLGLLVGISFAVAGMPLHLLGGEAFDSARLAELGRGDLTVSLTRGHEPCATASPPPTPGDIPILDCRPSHAAGELGLAMIDPRTGSGRDSVWLVARMTSDRTGELVRRIDRWFLVAGSLGLLLAIVVGASLARVLSRPITELAEKTERVDLDRLDQRFATGRLDELGQLANLLDAMTARLRASTTRLRDAERRVATGDLARQVNHDVKNGLIPIRNVLRHLSQVAADEPDRLVAVWRERVPTLEASVGYLDELARNYAKLAPAPTRERCDANELLRELARGAGPSGTDVRLDLDAAVPSVSVDRVALRRILENLLSNAVEAIDGAGKVTLSSSVEKADDATIVRLGVSDTGRGMTREQLERAFDDFFTTKPDGTGLGLSVVRRLVADLGGTLRVETEPGAGSRFTVEIRES